MAVFDSACAITSGRLSEVILLERSENQEVTD